MQTLHSWLLLFLPKAACYHIHVDFWACCLQGHCCAALSEHYVKTDFSQSSVCPCKAIQLVPLAKLSLYAWPLSRATVPTSFTLVMACALDCCRWLDAARYGKLHTMKTMLKASNKDKAALIAYNGKGTSYGLMGHTALHWAAAKVLLPAPC